MQPNTSAALGSGETTKSGLPSLAAALRTGAGWHVKLWQGGRLVVIAFSSFCVPNARIPSSHPSNS